MVPKTSYPPSYHHTSLTQPLTPSAFENHLSNFLQRTQHQPYLHPDSYLSTAGIRFSAYSGPEGGLALHHLRRICRGLKGESLVQETEAELAKFHSLAAGEELLPEGDDRKVDALISKWQREDSGDGEVSKSSKKRKRRKEVEAWADETSSQAEAPYELESFATTPMHVPDAEEWQEKEDFEQQQEPWFNDVDPVERAGAPVVKQGGIVPKIVRSEEAMKKSRREEKKAAKKERRKEMAEKQKKKDKG